MKTAVVTGGTRGIGAGIVEQLLAADYRVVVGARKENDWLKRQSPERVRFVAGDASERAAHFAWVDTAMRWGGKLDLYVNNAGLSQWRPIADVTPEFWQQMMAINASGFFWGCQAAASVLQDGGNIINISSLAGKRGSANNSVYCAGKFAVNGITQSLAKELGSRGIRVNAVCPVYVTTETILESLEDPRSPAAGQNVQTYLRDFTNSQTALKRLPTAKEIGRTCVFLASEAASGITGQCLNVDCGVLPQ